MQTYTVTFQVLSKLIAYTVSATTEKGAINDAESICHRLNDGRGLLVGSARGSKMPKGAVNGADLARRQRMPLFKGQSV